MVIEITDRIINRLKLPTDITITITTDWVYWDDCLKLLTYINKVTETNEITDWDRRYIRLLRLFKKAWIMKNLTMRDWHDYTSIS